MRGDMSNVNMTNLKSRTWKVETSLMDKQKLDADELLSKIYEELECIQQAIERLGKHLGHLAVAIVRTGNSES